MNIDDAHSHAYTSTKCKLEWTTR